MCMALSDGCRTAEVHKGIWLRFLRIIHVSMKKILAVVGARPQFIKHAPIELAVRAQYPGIELKSLHTGQHYDENMSAVFFDQLGMQPPDYQLHIGSLSHGAQTGRMMEEIENIVLSEHPDGMLVYGDTNSTLAGALVAAKLHIPVFHVEAGLRSFNRSMPEEINRVLTDHVSALLFVPTLQGVRNLKKEGIRTGVVRTGDIMYDLLQLVKARGLLNESAELDTYYFATIHRPYNTDDLQRLNDILGHLNVLDYPVKFPIHPRTKNLLRIHGVVLHTFSNIEFLDPLGYFENIRLMHSARGIITDSGGIQKEAYWLRRKCVTLRPETEWPETLRNGWNHLVFDHLEDIAPLIVQKPGRYIEHLYGNGVSRYEIIEAVEQYFSVERG